MEDSSRLKALELAVQFGVSESTTRRDLKEMEELKMLKRTHGGAVSVEK